MFRQILDISIFLSRHTLLAFLLFLALWWLVRPRLGPDMVLGRAVRRYGTLAAITFCLGLLVVFVSISAWYLRLGGFAGEVEPMVSSLSWMVQDGHPLYHDMNSSARYSVLYGPSVFLTNGLFLKILGPSLFSAKLASALASFGSLLLLYAVIQRHKFDLLALSVVGLSVLYYWCQGFAVYLVRPDSLLLFTVALGLYTTVKMRRWLAVLALGACFGFAVNLKAHSGLYFLPIIALLVSRFGWKSLWPTSAMMGLTVLAPFALYDQISLTNYLVWVKNAMGHGLNWMTLVDTGRFALGLLMPLGAALLLHPHPLLWLRSNIFVVAAHLIAVFSMLILSAKPGAGLVHLLPLVPSSLYLFSTLCREIPADLWRRSHLITRRTAWGQGALVAILMTVVFAGTVHEYRVCRLVAWENQEAHDLATDISGIQARFPGLRIGMAVGGEDQCFRYTWMRPLLVFKNNPLLLDPIAVMDCHLSGQELSPETYAALSRGDVAVWLVPKAQRPFAKVNWYPPHEPVFSMDFMAHFQANYSPRTQSRFFDLWIWNGLNGEALGAPALAIVKKIGTT